MNDIFLIYAMKDEKRAAKLVSVFEQHHWTVSWNLYANIPGSEYPEHLTKELEDTKVVVMLWSRASLKSDFMRLVFKRIGQIPYVVALLEKVELPISLIFPQTFDLSDWDNSGAHAGLKSLLRHVGAIIATLPPADAPSGFFEDLSLSEIQERARRGIEASAAALTKDDARFKGVFISYRRNEAAAYARGLYDQLVKRFGTEKVFLDLKNVGYGEDFIEATTSAAESCAVMIALISPRWPRGSGGQTELDDYVRLEVSKALGRKIRVIPILIQGATMPAPKDLPEDLSPLIRRNALALSDDARWERDVEDLIKNLEGLLKD